VVVLSVYICADALPMNRCAAATLATSKRKNTEFMHAPPVDFDYALDATSH
jgi:hypothetical protein